MSLAVEQDQTQVEPDALNPIFESAGTLSPEKVIEWSFAQFDSKVVMSSSFGVESAMLIHLATRVRPNIRILFVNTGYLFPETHRFMEDLRARFNLNVWTYRTRNDPIAWLHANGEENPSWRNDVDKCCGANKNEPFDRAMREQRPRAWLRGIRRQQSSTRRDRQFIEWSPRYNCWAVSPLLNLSTKQIRTYMTEHDLPYHPLYEKGYASIGCNPLSCTRPIGLGEDARDGRWSQTGKVECGINMTDSLDSAKI